MSEAEIQEAIANSTDWVLKDLTDDYAKGFRLCL